MFPECLTLTRISSRPPEKHHTSSSERFLVVYHEDKSEENDTVCEVRGELVMAGVTKSDETCLCETWRGGSQHSHVRIRSRACAASQFSPTCTAQTSYHLVILRRRHTQIHKPGLLCHSYIQTHSLSRKSKRAATTPNFNRRHPARSAKDLLQPELSPGQISSQPQHNLQPIHPTHPPQNSLGQLPTTALLLLDPSHPLTASIASLSTRIHPHTNIETPRPVLRPQIPLTPTLLRSTRHFLAL
ncbi:hypothetical protein V8E36_007659 [Tilletia maclaganii]